MTTLKTTLAGYKFDNCMMNAAGIRCATVTDLAGLRDSRAGSLVTKSATPQPRDGNPEPRMRGLQYGCINSMGLPNHGFDYYLNFLLEEQKSHPQQTNFMSIAGTTLEDDLSMLKQIQESAFAGLTELNLSCPNVPGKPQVGYDFDAVERYLTAVFAFFKKPLGVKLPPYFDLMHFDQITAILNQYPLAFVNSINSVGNGLMIDPESETVLIKPKGGFGGIGGAYIKPTALANVRALAQRLNPGIAIIGTGGVQNGMDIFEHILCGASMVQVGTQLGFEGPKIFNRLSQELTRIMAAKGYDSIADFRGKLKTL
ncbi:dihydroorotate oxidase [Loigolactobacillus backii]|uniref:dihydroorotate oxidase (fumarate) n=1 Tax=Loigolactobacillus backii TaxID=375175 RepID=A0A192H064_9LACO|nr:dihydroorotate oxidase [Loigolactobacillus backii]ANK60381.1 dihydroorotate dehydrogenase [Loigolactobacillus backii]ANK62179.1 dihydroorotate oxidase [Loigolactobacillus backii]ANK65261.1 dihydroorotate oxidase [Loigolactobacillus backii]ANK67819.1 dihydroorotate oxidase [Loigolactobacillus backii]ANK70806.1 dihydroorotate oxidase [Loigolactobacillus backii]